MSPEELAVSVREFLSQEDRLCAVFDVSGVLLGANQLFCKALGRDESEMQGHYFWDFIDPDSLDETLEILDQVSMRGSAINFVNCYLRPSGQRVWLSWNCNKADKNGNLLAEAKLVTGPSPGEEQSSQSAEATNCHSLFQVS